MSNDEWESNNPDNMEADGSGAPRPRLVKIYNIIDWIDFGLIIFIIAYMVNPDTFGFFPHVGLLIGIVSLAVSVSAIVVATKIFRQGLNVSKVRLIIRYIVWGIWIPIDLFFIGSILLGMR